jgi:hypothetical protein
MDRYKITFTTSSGDSDEREIEQGGLGRHRTKRHQAIDGLVLA